jgi:hypothetical protein
MTIIIDFHKTHTKAIKTRNYECNTFCRKDWRALIAWPHDLGRPRSPEEGNAIMDKLDTWLTAEGMGGPE